MPCSNPECARRIAELEAAVRRLQKENESIRRRLDEALRAQKRQTAPFSKGPPKANPLRPGRKGGTKYGTKAHRPPPEAVDETHSAPLPDRCECGGEIEWTGTTEQYQAEIPREPVRRRFEIDVGRCRGCGKRVQGRHELQTSDAVGAAGSQLGANAQAMVALMKNKLGASYGDIRAALGDFFGIDLTRGGAAQMVLRAGRRVESAYRGILTVVRRSRTVYPDETGLKERGLLQWLWVFVARTATAFVIRDSRGHDVPEEVLGANWSGTMVHDGWAPYDFFEKARHQQCLAHLLRRCRTLLEGATRGAVRFPRAVKALLQHAFAVRDRRDAGETVGHGLAVAIGRLEGRLERLLAWRLSNSANVRFAKHLRAHRNELFTFLENPGIEGTSWPADQAIRPAVVNRKVFGGNREPAGSRAHERLASVVATCAQRGVAVMTYVSRVLRAPASTRESLARSLLALPP